MVSFNNKKELWKCVSLANFVLSSTAWMLLSIGFPVGSLRDDYPACFLPNPARLIAAMAPLSMPPQFAVLPCTPLSKKWDLFPYLLNMGWSCDLLRPMEGNWSAPCACSELRPQEAFQASIHHRGPLGLHCEQSRLAYWRLRAMQSWTIFPTPTAWADSQPTSRHVSRAPQDHPVPDGSMSRSNLYRLKWASSGLDQKNFPGDPWMDKLNKYCFRAACFCN